MSLIDAFLAQVRTRADAPALITGDGATVSYTQLSERSDARARAMQAAGITKGDVVLVAHGMTPQLYETLLALFRLGAVAMFPEPAAGLKGLRHAITASAPKAVAAGGKLKWLRPILPGLRTLRPIPKPASGPMQAEGINTPVDSDAPALITFTSGSTGRPKGIVRSSGFLLLQHELVENLRQTKPTDIDLISLPVFVLSNLAAGATSVFPTGNIREPATLDGAAMRAQITEHKVNRVVAPPMVCQRLVAGADQPIPNLTAMFTGGGPVFPNLLHAMKRAAPDARIYAVYGSTEAEPIAHLGYDEISAVDWQAMSEGKGLLAGHAIPEIELRLADGEVQVGGAHVNTGYIDAEDDVSTKIKEPDRIWHRTGDGAVQDETGRLWLLGRISAAADGLHPFAVETAAQSWPGISAAALLAQPGQRARLAVCGDNLDLVDLNTRAAKMGAIDVVQLPAIPLDKRHNSKVDYTRLAKLLARAK